MNDEWWIVGNLGGNKFIITKLFEETSLKQYKTCYLENVKVGDKIKQVPELEEATPEEINKAGITINAEEEGLTITPDSGMGLFLIEKLQEVLIKMALEKKQTDTKPKKSSKKKTGGK